QELEIHAEVLELFALRVAHDCDRIGIGFDCQALLVPADRLGLLGQRGAQSCERSRRRRQLVRRLVVLVESHQHPPVGNGDGGNETLNPRLARVSQSVGAYGVAVDWLAPSELRVGLGCMRLPDGEDGLATIEGALDAGITVFDTARSYGGNERLLAGALDG